MENLQDEIGAMKTEIQRFQDDDVKFEEQRIAMIKEMEVNSFLNNNINEMIVHRKNVSVHYK